MKTLCTLFASLLLAGSAFGQSGLTGRVVKWDDQPPGFVASYYRVYLGTNAGFYGSIFTVTNALSFSNSYAPGNYFVSVSAVDTNGLESGFSDEIKFTIFPPVRIRVSLQSKRDLSDPWQEDLQFVEFAGLEERRFYRAKLYVVYP